MKKTVLFVIVITLIGAFLRFYKININPPSLNGDEVSFGYSAYSILKTGRDETGKILPIVLESVGDYKNPVPAYLMVFSIKLFGFNDFAVRFPNALLASLTIPVYYLFLKYLQKSKKIALFGTLSLAISSWHIFYSRFAYEGATASLFILLGVWFFMKMLDGNKWWGVASGVFLILTMYTSFAPRLFIPIFVIVIMFLKSGDIKNKKNLIVPFLVTCAILGTPLIYVSVFQGATTRLKMVFIGNDVNFVRYVGLRYFDHLTDLPLLLFFWTKRFLNYIQPDFLFVNGLNLTLPSTTGLGILYIFEAPLLIYGIPEFLKSKFAHKDILLIWLFTGLLPDSITNNLPHAGRVLQIAPVLILIVTLGFFKFFNLFKSIKTKLIKTIVAVGISVFVGVELTHAFLTFAVHFPMEKGETIDEGWREVVYYLLDHQSQYSEIVIDPRRGVDSRDMVSNPHIYYLFYSKYDPLTYQTEAKQHGTKDAPLFKFDKYSFTYINWQTDRTRTGTLFVGSPWSFPKGNLQGGKLVHKIFLTNGNEAFDFVEVK